MLKKIIISGATGFIGQAIIQNLLKDGYYIIALSRNPNLHTSLIQDNVKFVSWDAKSSDGWWEQAEGSLAFINLAGENIGSGIWTKKKKIRMIDSRLSAAQAISAAFERVEKKPKVIIQASAIGYYGDGNDHILNESSAAGQGFLSNLTVQWEQGISGINMNTARLIILRIGMVLGRNGGALTKMSLPFQLFLGGHFGNGKQWISWIHLQDVAAAVKFVLETNSIDGIVNVVSPGPVQAQLFFKKLGKVLRRPSWFHIPERVLHLLLGEMAQETLLISQRVVPGKLQASGFQFSFPELEAALRDILF